MTCAYIIFVRMRRFFLTLDAIDILRLVYSNAIKVLLTFKVRYDRLQTLNITLFAFE